MDIFGNTDPRKMPTHLFSRALFIDYETAVRGNPGKQNFSVCPRHWYLDVDFKCERCSQEFTWSAGEQKAWFEDYYFWVDSCPRHCQNCRADRKRLQAIRKEYDSTVGAARENGKVREKARIVELVTELELAFGALPEKMKENKLLFQRQLNKR